MKTKALKAVVRLAKHIVRIYDDDKGNVSVEIEPI